MGYKRKAFGAGQEFGIVDPVEIESIFGFIGYGDLDAPLWFLEREEGLGGRSKRPGWSLEWELQVRARWKSVMDARLAHAMLQDPYWEDPNRSQVWKHMAMFSRGLIHGASDWQDPEIAWNYVVNPLGRSGGETLIGEAFPLPKARIGSWPYTWLYPDQKTYKQSVWPQRKAMWQKLISEYSPRYIIAYGGWWQSQREIFGMLSWESINDGRVHVASMPTGTEVYLTPFFKAGLMQTGDLEAVIKYQRD